MIIGEYTPTQGRDAFKQDHNNNKNLHPINLKRPGQKLIDRILPRTRDPPAAATYMVGAGHHK